MKHLIIIFFALAALSVNAQTIKISPFKPLPKPFKTLRLDTSTSTIKATAYRFVGPMAGYDIINSKIVTGVGYGWNKLHYDNTTQKWVADLSIYGAAFATGSATPSIYANNIVSIGIGVGIKNNLINIIPCYNLPLAAGTVGKVGVVFTLSGSLIN